MSQNGLATIPHPAETVAVPMVPPHDLEAEASLLGAVLLDPQSIARVLDVIRSDDLYRQNNGAIYGAALALFRDGEPIDNVTVAGELAKAGLLDRVGGRAHLALLQENCPAAANIETYARRIRECSIKRQLIAAGTATTKRGYDPRMAAEEAVGASAQQILGIGQVDANHKYPIAEVVAEVMEYVEVIRSVGGIVGMKCGLADLDELTGGWKASELVIVGARPGTGKTSLAVLAAITAAKNKTPVLFFTIEMDRVSLILRAACMAAGVDSEHLKRNELGDAGRRRLQGELDAMARLPITVIDCPSLDEYSLIAQSRRAQLQEQVGLVVVDYLQLVNGEKRDNRVQEVSRITRSLKQIARDLRCPVLALAQLNRETEGRADKKPQLSDLRETGEIEATADQVILIHRTDAVVKLIVAKNRNGRTGDVAVGFRAQYTRFEDLERRHVGPLGDD